MRYTMRFTTRLSWATSRLAAEREGILDLLGEQRSIEILRRLATSSDPNDRRLALTQLDRLPEWLDLLMTWLDQPLQEPLVLDALNGVSRLTGPYTQLGLGAYLHREIQRSLREISPADSLWSLSLRVARWVRGWSALSTTRLVLTESRSVLAGVPEAFRDFSRRIEWAGRVEPDVARLLQAWPNAAEATPVPIEILLGRRSGAGASPVAGANVPPKVASGRTNTKLPKAA